MRKGKCKCVRQ